MLLNDDETLPNFMKESTQEREREKKQGTRTAQKTPATRRKVNH
jgi:hypothetical protein